MTTPITDLLAVLADEDRDTIRTLAADPVARFYAEVILPSGRSIDADALNATLEAVREASR